MYKGSMCVFMLCLNCTIASCMCCYVGALCLRCYVAPWPSPCVCCCVASSSSPHVWVALVPCVCVVLLHDCHCLVFVLHHHLVSMLPYHLVFVPSLCVYVVFHLVVHYIITLCQCHVFLLCHHLMFTLHHCLVFTLHHHFVYVPSLCVYVIVPSPSICVYAITMCLCCAIATN